MLVGTFYMFFIEVPGLIYLLQIVSPTLGVNLPANYFKIIIHNLNTNTITILIFGYIFLFIYIILFAKNFIFCFICAEVVLNLIC